MEDIMKKLALGLVAAGALLGATAAPALAQVGVYAGPGGVGVELGGPGYYRGPYAYGGYYDYAPGWNGGYYDHGWRGHRGYHRW
jgi:hypothetical protein